MKQMLIIGAAMFGLFVSVAAQNVAVSPVGSLNIRREVKPPVLVLTDEIALLDASGDGIIDADESAMIYFTVRNDGFGDGVGLRTNVKLAGNGSQGITCRPVELPVVRVGESRRVEIPLTVGNGTADGQLMFSVSVLDPSGYGLEEQAKWFATRAFLAPQVEVYASVKGGATRLQRNKPYTVNVTVQNLGRGRAEAVNVNAVNVGNVMVMGPSPSGSFSLDPGDKRDLTFTVLLGAAFADSRVDLRFHADESRHRYGKSVELSLDVTSPHTTAPPSGNGNMQADMPGLLASSRVVDNPPSTGTKSPDTRVLIIANGDYGEFNLPIRTALHDAEVVRSYCSNTLGVPDANITYKTNLSTFEMRKAIADFRKKMKDDSKSRFLFFYFGHGAPLLDGSDAYLLPTRCQVSLDKSELDEQCISRNRMMADFASAKPRQLVVYLESCYNGTASGSGEAQPAYENASAGIVFHYDEPEGFGGNIILVTASDAKETANAYDEYHNVFTYKFLEALGDNKITTWGELLDRASRSTTETVERMTFKGGISRRQYPQVKPSETLGNKWRQWPLR